eukprot:5166145-Heterocapsa_arctica.AAC.1
MVSGRPEERINYKLIVMYIVFFVEKRMQEAIIVGGNAERPTDTPILVASNSCKSETKSTTNRNVSGILE